MRAVAQTAHRLREGDLTARAPVSGTEETVELAQALNGLAERTTELLASERASVADLSHRLRTPVTALRLDSEAVTDPEPASGWVDPLETESRYYNLGSNFTRPDGTLFHLGYRQIDPIRSKAITATIGFG